MSTIAKKLFHFTPKVKKKIQTSQNKDQIDDHQTDKNCNKKEKNFKDNDVEIKKNIEKGIEKIKKNNAETTPSLCAFENPRYKDNIDFDTKTNENTITTNKNKNDEINVYQKESGSIFGLNNETTDNFFFEQVNSGFKKEVLNKSKKSTSSFLNSKKENRHEADFDIEKMTMAELCKPLLCVGKISENYTLVKEAQRRTRELKLKQKIDRKLARLQKILFEEVSSRREKEEMRVEDDNEKKNLDDQSKNKNNSLQLKIGSDGKIGFDSESLLANPRQRFLSKNRVVEESNPFYCPVTSSSYTNKKYTDRWTSDEIVQFYEGLSTFGTDFSLISHLFPHRTRKQIKLKFNLEEKKYPELIELALKRKLPLDFEKFCRDSKKKIHTLDYYDEQLAKIRSQHDKHISQFVIETEKALKEDSEATKKIENKLEIQSKIDSEKNSLRQDA